MHIIQILIIPVLGIVVVGTNSKDMMIFGGAALALLAGFYIMSKEGFLDNIISKVKMVDPDIYDPDLGD